MTLEYLTAEDDGGMRYLSDRPTAIQDRARRHRDAYAAGREPNIARCANLLCGRQIAYQETFCSGACCDAVVDRITTRYNLTAETS